MKTWRAYYIVGSALAVAGVALFGLFAITAQAQSEKQKETLTVQEKNKATVTAFYNLAFNDHKPAEAVERYLGKTYKQHNPGVGDGPQPFIDYVTGAAKANPKMRATIDGVIAEGDLVALHVHNQKNETDRGLAIVDIFRLEDGKIVEHWDVIQPVPEKAANEHTMFGLPPAKKQSGFPAAGEVYEVDFGGDFVFHLRHDSEESMTFTGQKGAQKGKTETVKTTVTPIRPGVFMVAWQEADKTGVVHIRDFENGIAYTNITQPSNNVVRLKGTLKKVK